MPSDTSSRSPDFPGLNALLAPRLDDHARWGAVADDWSNHLRKRRAFRIRGFTWFRESVEKNVRALVPAVYRMEPELRRRPSWLTPPWPWKEKDSAAQLAPGGATRSASTRAVKTLLLGVLVAAERGISSSQYYLHMRIEPATFRISGFNKDYLDNALKAVVDLPKFLRDSLGQPRRVFLRMAAGESVSYRIA